MSGCWRSAPAARCTGTEPLAADEIDPLFAVGGLLLLAGVVVHLVLRAVRRGDLARNGAVGIRTRATLRSEEAWRAGHRAALPYLSGAVRAAYTGAGVSTATAVLTRGDTGPALVGVLVATGLGTFAALIVAAARAADRAAARDT